MIKDLLGQCHFAANLSNEAALAEAMKQSHLSTDERAFVCEAYEATFHHCRFTGRSGTMYKYEGLGCIYWHQVSKLLLAVGETVQEACEIADAENVGKLIVHYRAIEEGIGAKKEPSEYGSFPFDAYSHTPKIALVQQPGMTGQVKEDFISRFFQMGVLQRNGQIEFSPKMLDVEIFGGKETISFTYCCVPVSYRYGEHDAVCYRLSGKECKVDGLQLPKEVAHEVFVHSGNVERIEVVFHK